MASVLVTGTASFAPAPATLPSPLFVLLDLVRIDSLPVRPLLELVELVAFNRVFGPLAFLLFASHTRPLCSFSREIRKPAPV